MRDFIELQNVILVGADTLGQAVGSIVGCQFCRMDTARFPFDYVLNRVTGYRRAITNYLLVECVAQCPGCGRGLAEKTLVEIGDAPSGRLTRHLL
jgi:hypothetical protein